MTYVAIFTHSLLKILAMNLHKNKQRCFHYITVHSSIVHEPYKYRVTIKLRPNIQCSCSRTQLVLYTHTNWQITKNWQKNYVHHMTNIRSDFQLRVVCCQQEFCFVFLFRRRLRSLTDHESTFDASCWPSLLLHQTECICFLHLSAMMTLVGDWGMLSYFLSTCGSKQQRCTTPHKIIIQSFDLPVLRRGPRAIKKNEEDFVIFL
jgi:hypothetical protein